MAAGPAARLAVMNLTLLLRLASRRITQCRELAIGQAARNSGLK
jgi:hypothetical protein